MLRSVPELHVSQRLPTAVRFAGDCLWERNVCDEELLTWIDLQKASGRRIIYVQHGRFFGGPHFWRTLLKAANDADLAVAASVGKMDCQIGEIPPTFYVRPYVPQGRVLPHAVAVVASANATAVIGACVSGIPSLLIPLGGEQPDIAALCEEAGIACVCRAEEFTSDKARTALDYLLNDRSLKLRTLTIADAFMRFGNVVTASALLDGLGQNTPVPSL